jgi:hypothetical protein
MRIKCRIWVFNVQIKLAHLLILFFSWNTMGILLTFKWVVLNHIYFTTQQKFRINYTCRVHIKTCEKVFFFLYLVQKNKLLSLKKEYPSRAGQVAQLSRFEPPFKIPKSNQDQQWADIFQWLPVKYRKKRFHSNKLTFTIIHERKQVREDFKDTEIYGYNMPFLQISTWHT